ncbi:electron transfer flavoprotein-ubiquinone oxidoreductase [Shewanella pealeana]|uniref:Electron transfer flavoprotein-ubiquinone oxidoreductase n=1 Tax=Shewanella pealeana (strain ATCC 700345 / ANG-SQ1) TaxID=398579 RepID=A8H4K5_SHEPA|nr:Electron-transferring-flavoprotein dehydrogenase [Shewanella pealeana ATCC 700345]
MREVMDFDVVIVGAGPSGLSAACRLMQLSKQENQQISVCVVEKGSEVGAHILSGAIIEPRAIDELFPDWRTLGAPLTTSVTEDRLLFLSDNKKSITLPQVAVPKPLHNQGNYIASLGNVCRWLAEQAEALGVEIFPGFAAAEVLYHEDGSVKGIATGDMGVSKDGQPNSQYMQGMELHAKFTLFGEGCRGHLGKELIHKFGLADESDAQHYGLGMKEIWDINPELHRPGLVVHGFGWPLDKNAGGGFFLYHTDNHQLVVGLIVDLNYSNTHLSPFDEFQRLKHHPQLAQYLKGGSRVSYGARAIAKGGLNALPVMSFAGGMLLGCNAGTLNVAKIKGTHTAMKSGMLCAETVFDLLNNDVTSGSTDAVFEAKFKQSWLYEELHSSRNFGPALHKYGTLAGGGFNYIDQNWFGGKLPLSLRDNIEDHACLLPSSESKPITYPKPDGILSFDKLTSVFLSNTNHEEDQPCHLSLLDHSVPSKHNIPIFDEPAARYCPAGVYEVVDNGGGNALQINAQNCLHCKTCDIKDPSQNIRWTVPEGGGGPSYPNM